LVHARQAAVPAVSTAGELSGLQHGPLDRTARGQTAQTAAATGNGHAAAFAWQPDPVAETAFLRHLGGIVELPRDYRRRGCDAQRKTAVRAGSHTVAVHVDADAHLHPFRAQDYASTTASPGRACQIPAAWTSV